MKHILFLIAFFFPNYIFAYPKLCLLNNSQKSIIVFYKTQCSDKTEKYVMTLPIQSGIVTQTDLRLISPKINVMILRGKKIFNILVDTSKLLIIEDNPCNGQLIFKQEKYGLHELASSIGYGVFCNN